MKVLVTGGTGYVGSVICSALIDAGHTPIILDLSIGASHFIEDKIFYSGDISDGDLIDKIIGEHPDIQNVIHAAERIAIEESVASPYDFYNSNVVKSLKLFRSLHNNGVKNIIFCSSASMYEDVAGYMVTDYSPINPRSPFSRSKYITEMMLRDFCRAYEMYGISLRIFNPIGADPQLRSGLRDSAERRKSQSSIVYNLMESAKESKPFVIAGNDWGTRDGTCIRDYIHLWDLARGIVKTVENFDKIFQDELRHKNYTPLNLGSGIGVTVKEFVDAFHNVTGNKISIQYGERRRGDVAGNFASTSRVSNLLGWKAELPIEEAILDAVRLDEYINNKE